MKSKSKTQKIKKPKRTPLNWILAEDDSFNYQVPLWCKILFTHADGKDKTKRAVLSEILSDNLLSLIISGSHENDKKSWGIIRPQIDIVGVLYENEASFE